MAKAQHRQQLKAQLRRHTTQLGELLRAHGFEDVSVEQAERWLKMALMTTPLTVLDSVPLPTLERQPEGREMDYTPTVDPQPERLERQPMPTPERQRGGSEAQCLSTLESQLGGSETDTLSPLD